MKYQDLPEHLKYLVVIWFGELVIGVVGNLTACIVILCSSSMRTLTDFYLLSLTISDLLFLIFSVFFHICLLLFIDGFDYVFNYKAAFFDCWIPFTAVRASIITVTVFTVERYLAVCHPFFIQSMDKKSRITKIISSIWLVAALIALLETIMVVYGNDAVYNDRADQEKVFLDIFPYVALMELMVYFVLPILLITVLYTLIGIKLYRSSIERQNITSQADRTNKKILMMFAVIIVVFFIAMAPPNIRLIVITCFPHSSRSVFWHFQFISALTYPLFPALNPIIYVIMSEKFRKAFKDLLLESQKKLSDWISTFRDRQTAEVSLEMI